jgi:transcriptional regulator with XRE-family HTH domain
MHLCRDSAASGHVPYADQHDPEWVEVTMAARRRRLAERRKALGHSQESLAEQLGTDRTTVGRWERGETAPYPHLRGRLCRVLQVTPTELNDLLTANKPSASAGDRTQAIPGPVAADPELTGARTDMNRRDLLRLLSVTGALVAVPTTAETAGRRPTAEAQPPDDLRHYADLNAHLWQVFGLSQTKRLVFDLVHDQLDVLVAQLDRTQSLAAHRELCVLMCELFQLAGEILFDSDRYTDAAHCYTLAASAGREAQSHDRWACALTRQAFVSMYDRQYANAAAMLRAASRIAQQGDSSLATRHWIAAVHAQALARLGERDACRCALDAASGILDLTGPVSPGGWLRFDGTRLDEERGACHLILGHADLAETALTTAMNNAASLRRRGSLLTDLASLGIHERDPDRVIQYADGALAITEQTRSSGYVGRKLLTLQTQLAPMRSDRRIADLDTRITQTLTTVQM